MKVGIISDTHGLLREDVLKQLEQCDVILHGGDINKPEILDTLRKIAPLYAVRGNNDKEWAADLPHDLSFELEGIRFFMVHNKKEVPKEANADIIVFGHSHKYFETEDSGVLWLNPGSCGKRRFDQEITMALLEINGSSYCVEKIVIPHEEKGR